jgi:hypothetical protein
MKSLELNWVRNVDKSLVIPEVIFHFMDDCLGQYLFPENAEVYDMDGRPHFMGFGVIVLNAEYPEFFETTIAHEWRHHWQAFHGMEYDGIEIEVNPDLPSYKKSLIQYYTQSVSEMDALQFEWKYASKKAFDPRCKEILHQYLK